MRIFCLQIILQVKMTSIWVQSKQFLVLYCYTITVITLNWFKKNE